MAKNIRLAVLPLESIRAADDEAAGVGLGDGLCVVVLVGQHLLAVGLQDVLDEGVDGPVVNLLHGTQRPVQGRLVIVVAVRLASGI